MCPRNFLGFTERKAKTLSRVCDFVSYQYCLTDLRNIATITELQLSAVHCVTPNFKIYGTKSVCQLLRFDVLINFCKSKFGCE